MGGTFFVLYLINWNIKSHGWVWWVQVWPDPVGLFIEARYCRLITQPKWPQSSTELSGEKFPQLDTRQWDCRHVLAELENNISHHFNAEIFSQPQAWPGLSLTSLYFRVSSLDWNWKQIKSRPGVWPLVTTLHSSGLTHQNTNYENRAGRTLFSGSSQTPPCWFSPWGWSPRGRHWCEWPWWRGVPLSANVVWRGLSGLTDTEAASWVVEGLALCRWCHTAGPERESSRAEQCRAKQCRCLTLHRSPPAATTTTITLPS